MCPLGAHTPPSRLPAEHPGPQNCLPRSVLSVASPWSTHLGLRAGPGLANCRAGDTARHMGRGVYVHAGKDTGVTAIGRRDAEFQGTLEFYT